MVRDVAQDSRWDATLRVRENLGRGTLISTFGYSRSPNSDFVEALRATMLPHADTSCRRVHILAERVAYPTLGDVSKAVRPPRAALPRRWCAWYLGEPYQHSRGRIECNGSGICSDCPQCEGMPLLCLVRACQQAFDRNGVEVPLRRAAICYRWGRHRGIDHTVQALLAPVVVWPDGRDAFRAHAQLDSTICRIEVYFQAGANETRLLNSSISPAANSPASSRRVWRQ